MPTDMHAWTAWWQHVCADLDGGVATAGAVWLSLGGEVVLHAAHGCATTLPAPEPLTLAHRFDLASVTKAVSTTTCILELVENGRLGLDQALGEAAPALFTDGEGLAALTPRLLLTHQSGLPAHRPYYLTCADRDAVRAAVLATPLEQPPGTACVYSDLGFLLLGFVVEAVTGQPQDEFFRWHVAEPLGLDEQLGYGPVPPATAVATEVDPWRGRLIRGEAHDENAAACGGVAGHAGLFGTVAAAGLFARSLATGQLLSRPLLDEVFTVRDDVAGERFWLGWKRLGYDSGDPLAFGHDGYTGTLLWVCPQHDLVLALLTNRVHPTRANTRISDARPRWVAAAAQLAAAARALHPRKS